MIHRIKSAIKRRMRENEEWAALEEVSEDKAILSIIEDVEADHAWKPSVESMEALLLAIE